MNLIPDVWIQIDRPGRHPVLVSVADDDMIIHVIVAALDFVKLNTVSPDMVSVKFDDLPLSNDAVVKDVITTASSPLLLHIMESEGM